jgi:hypothetical protein
MANKKFKFGEAVRLTVDYANYPKGSLGKYKGEWCALRGMTYSPVPYPHIVVMDKDGKECTLSPYEIERVK